METETIIATDYESIKQLEKTLKDRLDVIRVDIGKEANKQIGGNWQEPDVVRRRRERYEELMRQYVKDTGMEVSLSISYNATREETL